MKKFISISLILLFIVNSFGVVFMFIYSKHQIKQEFRQYLNSNIDDSELIHIVLPKLVNQDKYFHKTDDNEFSMSGMMYDVVTHYETKDSVHYYCINDKKEENLFKKFSELIASTNDGTNSVKKSINNLLKLLTTEYLKSDEKIIYNYSSNQLVITELIAKILHYIEVSSPPPKNLLSSN